MGVLLPEEFPLRSLRNDEERLVVQALCDRLTDGWLVFPSVRLTTDFRDHELDVVIAHESAGVAVIEVKGHRPSVRDGVWRSGGERMEPQPLSQARTNAYALRDVLRGIHPTLARLEVDYAVAFPNVATIDGRLPNDVDRSQVFTAHDLDDVGDAVDRLMTRRPGRLLLGASGVQAVTRALLPDCEFRYEPETRARLARMRLDVICDQQVQALASLDLNRRVCVTGGAGTGKTHLAVTWARRALLRGDRVLFTCFNRPLAASLRQRVRAGDPHRVGAFHELVPELDGIPPIEEPDDADRTWWEGDFLEHLRTHWHRVTERFDTIVVDEAQDFDPEWLDLLERLLDPDGPRRLLLLSDERQEVYARGYVAPDPDHGWTRCDLTANCRNTFQIASLLHRRFQGAAPVVAGPESEDLRWLAAHDEDELVEAVGTALDELEDRDHGADRVLVATFTSSVRDRLRAELGFAAWDEADRLDVVCENVHRVKGLEYDHVILAAHRSDLSDELLYVGASRAVMSLTVIGPTSLADRLGLADR